MILKFHSIKASNISKQKQINTAWKVLYFHSTIQIHHKNVMSYDASIKKLSISSKSYFIGLGR